MPSSSPRSDGALNGRRRHALLITPTLLAYRDHTGRRVDPLLRLHRVTLAQARQYRLDLSMRDDAPPLRAAIEVLTTERLPMRPPGVEDHARGAGEWYALHDTTN